MGVAVLGLLATACTSTPIEASFPGPSAPPIPPRAAESTTTSETAFLEEVDVRIAGALPDGTPFSVTFDHGVRTFPNRISAGIVMDVAGSPEAVGIVGFGFGSGTGSFYQDGLYVVAAAAGSGVASISFYDHILEELGPDAEEIITSSILASSDQGFPVLVLLPPFRWPGDDEVLLQSRQGPLTMEISFGDYVVRRGCGESALACSPTESVQVIPVESGDGTGPNWDEIEVVVDSNS